MKINTHSLLAAALGLGLSFGGVAAIDTAAAGTRLLQQRATVAGGVGQSQVGGLAIPFQATCAPGFSKAGEKEANGGSWDGWMDWYVCTTPVLTCPKQLQNNGLYSSLDVQAIVQVIGGDPDGGQVKFRVQYKCDYGMSVYPEG